MIFWLWSIIAVVMMMIFWTIMHTLSPLLIPLITTWVPPFKECNICIDEKSKYHLCHVSILNFIEFIQQLKHYDNMKQNMYHWTSWHTWRRNQLWEVWYIISEIANLDYKNWSRLLNFEKIIAYQKFKNNKVLLAWFSEKKAAL